MLHRTHIPANVLKRRAVILIFSDIYPLTSPVFSYFVVPSECILTDAYKTQYLKPKIGVLYGCKDWRHSHKSHKIRPFHVVLLCSFW